MNVTTLYPAQCILGESPFWHNTRQSYFWVDIEAGILHELNSITQDVKIWNLDRRVSVILENKDGKLVLALQGGIVLFNPEDGSSTPIVNIDDETPNNRCNDGACDSDGRLWVGTMDVHAKENAGSLYCVEKNLTLNKKIDKVTIPNGIVWSADNERMYFVDTMLRVIKSYLFNKKTGEIYFEKNAVVIPDEMGYPDGMAIDDEGMLWIALYGGSAVGRWNPKDGTMLHKIDLQVPHITNCCFSGEKLTDLVITSARENLDEKQLADYPESGNVFIVKNVGVKGVKSFKLNY